MAPSLLENLLSPVVLAFALGMIASAVKSDLELPKALYASLSIYLLLAIGLKGGVALSETPLAEFAAPAGATLVLGLATPLIAFSVLRYLIRLTVVDSSAIAAHYGSVSAVTFIASDAFARRVDTAPEPFLPALVAILEVPAILVALSIASRATGKDSWRKALHEVATSQSILLLVGGLAIGWIGGKEQIAPVEPFFFAGFHGALFLFLLELGMVTARRLREFRVIGVPLATFAILVPIVHGVLGVVLGTLAGLSAGGASVLGAMVASASYIAAPAAVRIALPSANPAYYLTTSLGITFPFNLALGIPLYHAVAVWLAGNG